MVSIVAFHVVMVLLALGIATQKVSAQSVSSVLGYLHKSIGITTPPMEQVRTIALFWIGSTIVLVDLCLFLTVLLTWLAHTGR